MTLSTPSRRVRPGFRRFAIAAFVVLVPVAMHTAWDHYEARRLARIVADIRARNEPVDTVAHVSAKVESPENAARYYEAAAALLDTRDVHSPVGLIARMDLASDGERPQVVQQVTSWLERNREAETMLARATALPFEGYAPGTSYGYRADRLFRLAELGNLRTFERLEAGDPEAAAQSIVQQLRINRPMSAAWPSTMTVAGLGWGEMPALRAIGRLLATAPSDASLDRIQMVIRALDNDHALAQSILGERALLLGDFWTESRHWYASHRTAPSGALWYIMRPLMARRFIERLDIMRSLLDQARQPWPARLHVDVQDRPPRSRARGRFPFLGALDTSHTLGTSYRRRAANAATALALGRTADAAIAIERYRRSNGGSLPGALSHLVPAYLAAVPVDPFSGGEVRYLTSPDRWVVYSVGSNGKDDRGVKVEYPLWRSRAFQDRAAPPDLGVAFQLSAGRTP